MFEMGGPWVKKFSMSEKYFELKNIFSSQRKFGKFVEYFVELRNVPNFGHLFTLFASADRKKDAVQRTLCGKDAVYSGTYSHKLVVIVSV